MHTSGFKKKSHMAYKQTTSYENCNQSTNCEEMKREGSKVDSLVVGWVHKKRKVADRVDGGRIVGVDGGDEGEGREGRTSSTQPECTLGAVATFWSKQTQAVAPSEVRKRKNKIYPITL